MTEPDDPYEKLRNNIQAVVDAQDDQWIPTDWVLVVASVRPEDAHEGVVGYDYAIRRGQGLHTTRGLIENARSKFSSDYASYTSLEGDDDDE